MPVLQPVALGNLRVVLVAARNPLNIGAAARAMSNFGFSRLRVVNPYEVAFREARSAMGASALLAAAEEFRTMADALADCSLVVGTTAIGNRAPQHPVRTLVAAAALIRKRLGAGGSVALLFGSEKFGLSNDDLSHCHWLLHIPTRKDHRSMNVGQAVAVCLYEMARVAAPRKLEQKPPRATSETVERITTKLLDALHASGYVKRSSEASAEEKLRRLVRRLDMAAPDAEVLLGMIHKILWKLRSGA
jgi:TrmH family RNA methyltransferase